MGGYLPPGKCSWYPLDRRLGGPQSQPGHGETKLKVKFHASFTLALDRGSFTIYKQAKQTTYIKPVKLNVPSST
jgi:hypothetical protein